MNEMPRLSPLTDTASPDGAVRVVSDPEVLTGMPVVRGTRVPAATVVAYLRDGYSLADIAEDYPTLPANWLGAVEEWADREYGTDWRTRPGLRP